MDKLELLFYGGILIANLLLLHQNAKHGFIDIGIRKKVDNGLIVGFAVFIITMTAGGIYHKYNETFNPEPNFLRLAIVFGIPILWLLFYRYVLMPKGQFEYNLANNRTKYWMSQNLVLGQIMEEKGDLLRNFGRAKKTIALFMRSIKKQEEGKTIRAIEKYIDLDEEYYRYDNFPFNCLGCGNTIGYPTHTNEALTASCPKCSSLMFVKKKDQKLYIHTMLKKSRKIVTKQNNHNIAVAYQELGLLYRMMNMFDKAKESIEMSLSKLEDLLEQDPKNKGYLQTWSLAIFRLAEINHVTGNKDEARELYNESLAIDEELGDTVGIQMNKEMLCKL